MKKEKINGEKERTEKRREQAATRTADAGQG